MLPRSGSMMEHVDGPKHAKPYVLTRYAQKVCVENN